MLCLVTQSCPTLCNAMDCSLQAPLSMEFSRQEYWSGLPFPSPGDLPESGMELEYPALAGGFFIPELPGKPKLTGEKKKIFATTLLGVRLLFQKMTVVI